jgi:hypothetical protein
VPAFEMVMTTTDIPAMSMAMACSGSKVLVTPETALPFNHDCTYVMIASIVAEEDSFHSFGHGYRKR